MNYKRINGLIWELSKLPNNYVLSIDPKKDRVELTIFKGRTPIMRSTLDTIKFEYSGKFTNHSKDDDIKLVMSKLKYIFWESQVEMSSKVKRVEFTGSIPWKIIVKVPKNSKLYEELKSLI